MPKETQKRAIETRTKLLETGAALVRDAGFSALRVEEVVLKAGVSKGTFFARFTDKDGFMAELIGAELAAHLDRLAVAAVPARVEDLVAALAPLHDFMTCERYVFDIIIRYSGAAQIEEIGPVAKAFERYVRQVAEWQARGAFRKDIDPGLAAEGVQAFAIQAMALEFCALNAHVGRDARLTGYLRAWLAPPNTA